MEQDAARVARTGTPLSEVEVSGPERRWMISYWPVRRGGETIGVGVVVIEVTERRVAERALREQTDRYETLLHALSDAGEGLVLLELDGRCVYANPAFEQLSGYTFPELAAMDSVLGLVGELERIGEGVVPRSMRRRDGAWLDIEVGATALQVEGRHQLVVVVRDVSDRRRAEAERERLLARAALLAEASVLFDRSLDEELTLRRVAQLCVRDIADTCVILLGDAPDRVRGVVVAARDEARERELLAALDRERDLGEPLAEVMRGGAGQVAATPAGLGTARSVVVPLRARGRARGVLAAGFDDLGSAEDAEALALFEDLARRAALALDNARLYAERDQVARTLQRSLLPGALPAVPGVELAGRYVAAGEGNEVGGDFYDCFATGGGDWALVIGDVCGKGAEAAALTALARYTLRAAAQHTRRPQAVLLELNDALLRDAARLPLLHGPVRLADAAGGRRTVSLATGGHPLPLVLRAGGEVETAGSPGTLLGSSTTRNHRARHRARPRRRARARHRRRDRGRPLPTASRPRPARGAARGPRGRGCLGDRRGRRARRARVAGRRGARRRRRAGGACRRRRRAVCRPRGGGSGSVVKLFVVTPAEIARSARAIASAPTSRSNGPITFHSARSRSAAVRSTGCTRASLTSAQPSSAGSTQWPNRTRTVPGSSQLANASGPSSRG